MSIDPKDFRSAMGRFASGVTVVTVRGPDGEDHGMTASAFCSLSMDPPLALVCIKEGNRTLELLETDGPHRHKLGISLLARDQEERSNRFAGGMVVDGRWERWPDGRDKFEDVAFTRGETSEAALLDGALANLDCTVEHVHAGGDHKIVCARIHGIRLADTDSPDALLYFSGSYGRFGK
jgi:flavin reductase